MAVTEFALIELLPDYDRLEMFEILMDLLEVQDEWVKEHQPHQPKDPSDYNDNLTKAYTATTDPPYLLLVAPWDSPEAHQEWIDSKENQEGFPKLQKFFVPSNDSMVLFHMTTAGEQTGPPPDFLDHDSFDVDRFFAHGEDEKNAVQERYGKLENTLLELNLADHFWGGWRIEKPENGSDELVVFSCQDHIPQEHLADKLNLSPWMESLHFQQIAPGM